MLRSHVATTSDCPSGGGVGWAGLTTPVHIGNDEPLTSFRFVQVSIGQGGTSAQLHGHELGHALQYGTYGFNGLSGFYNQTIDANESSADVHGFRYQGLPVGYDCSAYDHVHYLHYAAIPDLQTNKAIGDCHQWLLSRTGTPYTYHGVSVAPVPLTAFDQVWYRAMDLYFTGGNDYFDWWNQQIVAARDLYGPGSATYNSYVAARDAVGGWTPNATLTTSTGSSLGGLSSVDERIAAVGPTASAARTPCIFFRTSTNIRWSCRESTGWRAAATLNSASDPAVSEPAATFRWENNRNMVYVFWTGTDSHIRYRTLDTTTYAVSGPLEMGTAHIATGAVAVAPIYETAALDRVMVVYHPSAHPSFFYATWVGSTTATDLGPSFDSSIAPAMVGFPYYDRVYFVRPDSSGAHNIRYTSYSIAGGWSTTALSISDLYSGISGMPAGVVSSDHAVALAQFQRGGTPRLRMAFTTNVGTVGGQRELWYATLIELSPGVLWVDLSNQPRAVPLEAAGPGMMQSPGGLTVDSSYTSIWSFWGTIKPAGWQSFSN